MASIEEMKSVLTKSLNAFCARDWNTYKELITDDATYEEEATGRRAEGRDAFVQSVEPWMQAFPDMKFTLGEIVGAGDALVVELEWRGTHLGPLAGSFGTIPATGKKGGVSAVQVVRFDGDRIREVRHYFDLLTILRQIGVVPQLPAEAATGRGG